jgi:hypothetical protein
MDKAKVHKMLDLVDKELHDLNVQQAQIEEQRKALAVRREVLEEILPHFPSRIQKHKAKKSRREVHRFIGGISIADRLVKLLDDKEEHTSAEITKAMRSAGIKKQSVYSQLHYLVKHGTIKRVDTGKYIKA